METRSKKPNPIDVEVGRRIRMRRVLLGLSQSSLAEGLGITFQQVQKYEKGTNRVGASRLQAIGQILETPVSFFFEGQQPTGANEDGLHGEEITEFLSTAEGLALNKSFTRIQSADVRRKVVGLVKTLADGEVAQEPSEDTV
ncbi:helix-turn-helix domain-containing protein [Agrobacterium tomkonis]|uniref:helix-turn-helix domain-containing protein n=1 Tax=Agrobacterium tomkonis TaxID=1183410 RepID=UPI001CD8C8E8